MRLLVKYPLIVGMFIALLVGQAFGAAPVTYYVDTAAADDTGNGTTTGTAWKTITKVNASSFAAGDSVLFKRGGTWSDATLIPPSSGSSGSPITFGAYGTGTKPIIYGGTALTSWTQYTGAAGELIEDNFDDGNTTGWTKAGAGAFGAIEKNQFIWDDEDAIPKKCKSTNAACYTQP